MGGNKINIQVTYVNQNPIELYKVQLDLEFLHYMIFKLIDKYTFQTDSYEYPKELLD